MGRLITGRQIETGSPVVRKYVIEKLESSAAIKTKETGQEGKGRAAETEEREKEAAAAARVEKAYDEGRREGEEKTRRELEEVFALAGEIIEETRRRREFFLREAEEDLVKLSLAVAEKVIRTEVKENPDTAKKAVKEGIRRLIDRDGMVIRVNPQDLEKVKSEETALARMAGAGGKPEIIPDESVGKGGCVIQTKSGSVDAQVDTQVAEIKDNISIRKNETEA